jgi:TM2 domain-containing membrane protein YozV
MQRITRIEVVIWIILTIIIFLIPLYKYILQTFRYLSQKIGHFFGIVKNMTPEDFLKGHEPELLPDESPSHTQDII